MSEEKKKKKKDDVFLLLAGAVPTGDQFSIDELKKKKDAKIEIVPKIDPQSVFKPKKKKKTPFWLRKNKNR